VRARALFAAAAGLLCIASPAPAQLRRVPQCEAANDEVTRLRLGHDRAGKTNAINAGQAVAAGRRVNSICRGDNRFLIAYALARIDRSRDIKNVGLDERGTLFNSAMADLNLVKSRVGSRHSTDYEIFNILGLIQYDLRQYDTSIATLRQGEPFVRLMSAKSRQNLYFTKGMAQYQLRRIAEADAAFALARQYGHPTAASWQARIRPSKK